MPVTNDEVEIRRHLPVAPHVLEILLSLSHEPMHGYGLIQDIRARTGGDVNLGTSTLYATIRRMERDGLVANETAPEPSSEGPPRRYYRITDLGREVARSEARRLRRVAESAAALLEDSLTRAGDR